MNLKGIKKNKAFKYLIKQQKETVKTSQYRIENVKTVCILAEEDLFKAYDFTKKLSEDLGINMIDIQVMLFQKEKSKKSLDNYEFFSDKSFNMFGKIKDKNLNYFLEKKFDLLINYANQDNVFAHVLAFKSNANIKASFKNEFISFYQISINIPGNKINTFNDEVVKYLKILNLIV